MKLNSLLERLAPRAVARWQSTPFVGSLLQSFTDWLGKNGYTQKTIRHRLGFLPKLGSWFKRQGLVSLDGLTQEHLDAAQRAYRRRLPQMSQVVGSFSQFLREQGLIREREPDPPSPSEHKLIALGGYLREVHGLAASSVRGHQRRLRPFLHFLRFDQRSQSLTRLRHEQIEQFLCRSNASSHRQLLYYCVC